MRRSWLRCCFPCSDEEGEESRGHPTAATTTTTTARGFPRALSRSRSFESHSSKSFSSRRTPDPGKSARKALKMSLTDRERILQLVQQSHNESQWSSPLDEDALSNISFEDVQVPRGTDAPYVPVNIEDEDALQVPVWSLRAMVTRSRERNVQMKRSGHHLLSMSGREKIKNKNASKSRREQQLILAQAIVAKYAKDENERNVEWRNSCKSMPARPSQLWRVSQAEAGNHPEGRDEHNETQSQAVEIPFSRSISEKIGINGRSHEVQAMQLHQLLIENECTEMHGIQMPEVV